MNNDVVLSESTDHIVTITINRHDEVNPLRGQDVSELRKVFDRPKVFDRLEDADDRVAVLTTADDKAFSGGADLTDPSVGPDPCVAACDVGNELAAVVPNTDVLYLETHVKFCGGLITGVADRLPHKIAGDFTLTGARSDGLRANETGMVNRVTPVGEHVAASMDCADIIGDGSSIAIGTINQFVRDTETPLSPSEEQTVGRRDLLASKRSGEQKEGAMAFVEKRKPMLRGR